jgi:penicillin-binding protein 1A
MDSPQALGGVDDSLSWKPRNYDGEFKGPMTLRNALEVSRNIPTVRLVQDLGVSKIHDFVKRWHINAEIPKDMSLSLGSFGISLAELTKGYAVFPNGGKAVRLHHITSIKDRTGKSYSIPPADPAWPQEKEKVEQLVETETNGNPFQTGLNNTQVYDPRLAYVMSHILRGVTLYGTAATAGRLTTNIGGKTGTTNNYIDALFVGFSANIVVGTWVGFDDNRPLGYGETGGKTALPMWIDYMSSAIPRFGAPDFPVPEGITMMLVNKQTGKPSPQGSGDGFLESFATGFDPNSDTSAVFETGEAAKAKAPTLDDASYWENQ